MKNQLDRIINAKILKVETVHDYWTVILDIGAVNINNNIEYCTQDNLWHSFNMNYTKDIEQKYIKKVIVKDSNYIELRLSSKCKMRISLKDEDYNVSPEAMSVGLYSGEIIVIN